MSPRRDFINPWKQRVLWNLIKYHFWHRTTRNSGRAEQESIGTFFACLCDFLLLVTVGDKILTQLDLWSEHVCLVGFIFFSFFCEKKSCFYLLRLEKRSRLVKIHCGIPLLLMIGFFECLWSLFLSLTVSIGLQAQISGTQWRGLPYHLPFTLISPLIPTYRLIFSLF